MKRRQSPPLHCCYCCCCCECVFVSRRQSAWSFTVVPRSCVGDKQVARRTAARPRALTHCREPRESGCRCVGELHPPLVFSVSVHAVSAMRVGGCVSFAVASRAASVERTSRTPPVAFLDDDHARARRGKRTREARYHTGGEKNKGKTRKEMYMMDIMPLIVVG